LDTIVRPLSARVLAVARTRVEGTWAAYIDAVAGVNHDYEKDVVLRNGDKLTEELAIAIFPEFKDVPYAR
jgi:hypothetical protein